MGIAFTGCVLLSLSVRVLSIDGDANGGYQGWGDPELFRRISREELRSRKTLARPLESTVDCDGMMHQQPTLPPTPDDALNFFTIGDWGVRGLSVGSDSQISVARAMSCVARSMPPKFIATLGDNFYPVGVTSVEDKQFKAKFEEVYDDASLHVPWFPVLGDHDHCGNVRAQSEYSRQSSRWTMPRAWYTQYVNLPGGSGGTVQLIFVDWVALEGKHTQVNGDRRFHDMLSHAAGLGTAEVHWEWLRRGTRKGRPTWRIVMGHRPLVSVSQRSARDDLEYPAEARTRRAIRDLMESVEVDLWINGHDHTAQVACSMKRRSAGSDLRGDHKVTHFMTNGIGGYDLHAVRPEEEWPEETKYANNTYHGFGVHHVTNESIKTYFVNDKGDVQHEFTIHKRHGSVQACSS